MAGLIPRNFIDDLLARTDVVEVIEGYVKLSNAGRNYKACCPFHHEKSPSFTVSREKQFYHCFGCGAHGVREESHCAVIATLAPCKAHMPSHVILYAYRITCEGRVSQSVKSHLFVLL